MKPFLFLLCCLYSAICFSQTDYKAFNDKYEEFAFYAKPNKTNKLSKYFEKQISSKLINGYDTYRISDDIKSPKIITLTFRFDEQTKIKNIIVNSSYSELNKSIQEAFKNYDIEDLNIPEKSPLNTYVLQILSSEGDKMVINCSTHVVYDRIPIVKDCESCKDKYKLYNCLNKQISEHVANAISPIEIKKSKQLGTLNLEVKFLINEQGIIEQIDCKAPTDSLTKELNRVVGLFPKVKIPASRNGKPIYFAYKTTVSLQIDTNNEKYKEESLKYKEENLRLIDTLLNPNSELAIHFKNNLNPEELTKVVFPSGKQDIYLSFNFNKNGNPINIKTNSHLPELNNRLVEIFKKYSFEKLNIKSTNILESYKYPIIVKRFDKKSIKSTDKPTVFIPPIFDKNCGKSKNPDELEDCLDQNIKEIVVGNFKNNIRHKTKLTGIIRISCHFQIDANGNIINVKATAPNPSICNELEQIIKNIPSVYQPAFLNGKAVKTSYNYSYRFNNGKIDEFKNLIRTYYKRGDKN